MKQRIPLLILLPTAWEFEPFAASMPSMEKLDLPGLQAARGRSMCAVQSGLGRKRSLQSLEKILTYVQPELIVSSGCAGALHQWQQRGSICSADAVHASGLESIKLEHTWLGAQDPSIRAAIVRGDAVSVQKPADRDRKMALMEQFPASIMVDMESYWIVQYALAQGMAAAVLRIIVDRLEDPLPDFRSSALRARLLRYVYQRRAARGMKKLCSLLQSFDAAF
jgi:nucleoside phosphorylase